MTRPKFLCVIIPLLLIAFSLVSQRVVKNIPQKFLSPKDIFDPDNKTPYLKYLYEEDDVAFNTPWLVISDRDNNKTYNQASMDSGVKTTMNFGDYGYVTEVSKDGEWIRVVDAFLSGNEIKKKIKDYGWVRKEKMLLWTSGIVSPFTKIGRKVFLVNKIEAIEPGKMDEMVSVFNDPISVETKRKIDLFKFYFVYKKEDNRLLLAKKQSINNRRFIGNTLVGWVDATKAIEWNTRLAIEPNFTKKGFRERQKDKSKRLIGFGSRTAAEAHATIGAISNIWWDNDPSFVMNKDLMSESNPRRFKGEIFRFPYLGAEEKATKRNFIRSGVVHTINGTILPQRIDDRFEEIKRKDKKQGYTDEQIDNFFSKEMKFYTEVYFPKEIDGSRYSPLSYVLLLSREELKNHLNVLSEITEAEDRTYYEKRKTLMEAQVRILERIAGDKKEMDFEDLTYDEFLGYLYGIKEEGLKLSKASDTCICNCLDEKNVSDARIDKFIDRIKEKERKLYKIYNDPDFDIVYKSGNETYYWIPVEDFF